MFRSLFSRIRHNHALEHATLNLVSKKHPGAQSIGLSGPFGFTIYTSLTAKEIIPAVMDALKRLQSGEGNLRVHHNCGTNLVVTAVLTTLATLIGMKDELRRRLRIEGKSIKQFSEEKFPMRSVSRLSLQLNGNNPMTDDVKKVLLEYLLE